MWFDPAALRRAYIPRANTAHDARTTQGVGEVVRAGSDWLSQSHDARCSMPPRWCVHTRASPSVEIHGQIPAIVTPPGGWSAAAHSAERRELGDKIRQGELGSRQRGNHQFYHPRCAKLVANDANAARRPPRRTEDHASARTATAFTFPVPARNRQSLSRTGYASNATSLDIALRSAQTKRH